MRFSLDMRQTIYILLLSAVLLVTGCTNCGDAKDDEQTRVAWQRYNDARKAKDGDRSLALIDSMEQAKIVSSPRADCLRAFVYDEAWQMRLAELYYKKTYEALVGDPAQDWALYGDAGYRYACMMNQRGDVEGSLAVATAILAKAEGNSDFPAIQEASLLQFMAGCQAYLSQQSEAKQTYLKSYEIMEEAYGKEGTHPFSRLTMCFNMFSFFLGIGDYDEATAWLARYEEWLHTCEQQGDSPFVEECKGKLALNRTILLQAMGHEAEATAVYNAIPDSRISTPVALHTAANYLMDAGRYSEAADMYARFDTTFVTADSARKTFDIIHDRIAPHYTALRKAGRNAEALEKADSICAAIDSALVWQRQDDAAELAVIYQTHEKELALEESKAETLVYRILAVAAFLVCGFIAYLLWRSHIYNKVLLEKSRHLVAEIEQREQAKAEERASWFARDDLTADQQLFRRLCTLMADQQPYTDETLNRDALAALLGSNAKYVEQAIRECSHGETVSDFITRHRLEHVARLLKTTDDPISLIGEQSGIPSRVTLARLFRNAYGMTCSEYRQAARAEKNSGE